MISQEELLKYAKSTSKLRVQLNERAAKLSADQVDQGDNSEEEKHDAQKVAYRAISKLREKAGHTYNSVGAEAPAI